MHQYVCKLAKNFQKKKFKKDQLQNVISLRINNEEKRTLENLTKASSKSISEIMRQAVELWAAKRHQLYVD